MHVREGNSKVVTYNLANISNFRSFITAVNNHTESPKTGFFLWWSHCATSKLGTNRKKVEALTFCVSYKEVIYFRGRNWPRICRVASDNEWHKRRHFYRSRKAASTAVVSRVRRRLCARTFCRRWPVCMCTLLRVSACNPGCVVCNYRSSTTPASP